MWKSNVIWEASPADSSAYEDGSSSWGEEGALDPQALLGTSISNSEIISALRTRFGVTYFDASDKDLQNLLKDQQERKFLESVVKQDSLGQKIAVFLTQGYWKTTDTNFEKEFFKSLSNKTLLSLLEKLARMVGMDFLSITVKSLSVLLTIGQGALAIKNFQNAVLNSYHMRAVLEEYFSQRENRSADDAF